MRNWVMLHQVQIREPNFCVRMWYYMSLRKPYKNIYWLPQSKRGSFFIIVPVAPNICSYVADVTLSQTFDKNSFSVAYNMM